MKKLLKVVAMLSMVCTMACAVGCNRQVVDAKLKFDKAYVKIGDEWKVIEVKKWMDYEGEQIQITTEDGTVFIVSSMNIILYKGELPIE